MYLTIVIDFMAILKNYFILKYGNDQLREGSLHKYDPRVPQTPKPKQITGEKTLCNVKCPDG